MLLFKALGLLLVFAVSVLGGILMSERLRLRAVGLEELLKAFGRLASLIRTGGYETEELCEKCFKAKLITAKNGELRVNGSNLNDEDIVLLEDFTAGFGLLEPEGEADRVLIYSRLLDEQYKKAKDEYTSLSRLYRSVGIMSGLILCIFLM